MNDNNPFPWWSSLLVLCHTDRQNRRMLLSGPRNERQHRASVLLSGLLMFIIATGCASFPAHSHTASSKCPRIDCALKSRHPCKLGSAHCGPCLDGFKENDRQHCVESDRIRRHHKAKEMSYADLDKEEIDIDSVIEKQQILPNQPILSVSSSQTDASELKPKSQSRSSTKNNTTTIKPPTPTPQPRVTGAPRRAEPVAIPVIKKDGIILILISVCVLVGSVAVILAAVCWIRLQKKSHLAQKVDYPAFGGGDKPPKPPAAANGTSVGDKTLAQSVQMYHYQHQKQQMLSMGKHKPEQKVPESEVTSDEEEMGGDFTVYECPGLAPTGEMEVKNPLFDDSTLHYQGNHK